MSSLFDSEVYAERQRLPGVSVSISKLMKDLLWRSGGDLLKPVTLTVEYRRDVDTSQWWTLKWGDDQFVAAKDLELCLFRAAVAARKDDERAKKYAGIEPRGPCGMPQHAKDCDCGGTGGSR